MAQFPNTNILDTATRSNEGPPPSANWTKPTYGSFVGIQISSNAFIQSVNNTTDGMAYWNNSLVGPDCEAYITIKNLNAGDTFVIVHARYDVSVGNGYKVDWDAGTSRMRIFRDDAGTRTQLGGNISQSMSAGDSFGIQVIGNNIGAWYKASGGVWSLLSTQIDSTYTAAGNIMMGCWSSAAGAGYSNYGGGSLNVMRKTLTYNGTRTGSRQTVI